MRKLYLLFMVIAIIMLYPATAFGLANHNPTTELAWLSAQLGVDNLVYIGEAPSVSGLEATVSVPDGALYYIVKGGSDKDNSDNVYTDIKYGIIPKGATTITVNTEGLVNRGGNQPGISHIRFFGEKVTPPVEPPKPPVEPPVEPPVKPPVKPPAEPTKDHVPQTGSTDILAWWAIATLATIGLGGTLLKK